VRLLLDTHVLLWWLSDDRRLTPTDKALIGDAGNDVLVSVVSMWEVVVKIRVGKLRADIGAIERALMRDGFERLGIAPAHLASLASLPTHHRDPFDHLLIAQAISETAMLISDDRNMSQYPVQLHNCGSR
jgi:PIN domain nuclease of toxin-antitoxin system